MTSFTPAELATMDAVQNMRAQDIATRLASKGVLLLQTTPGQEAVATSMAVLGAGAIYLNIKDTLETHGSHGIPLALESALKNGNALAIAEFDDLSPDDRAAFQSAVRAFGGAGGKAVLITFATDGAFPLALDDFNVPILKDSLGEHIQAKRSALAAPSGQPIAPSSPKL